MKKKTKQTTEKLEVKPREVRAVATFALPQSLTIENVRNCKDDLEPLLKSGTTELNASGLERVDTAALQMLAVCLKEADGRVTWREPAPALIEAARLLGLGKFLCLPSTQTPR